MVGILECRLGGSVDSVVDGVPSASLAILLAQIPDFCCISDTRSIITLLGVL